MKASAPATSRRLAWAVAAAGLAMAAVSVGTGSDAVGLALRAVACVGLLALGVLAVRGGGKPGPPGAVALLERRPLARETGIAVVAVQGRRLLVGYGPSGVAWLADLPPAPVDAEPPR